MSDHAPPVPPHPKAAAKGLGKFLSGRPAWQYVAGITVLIGVAYLVHRRQQKADAAAVAAAPDNTSGAYQDPTVSQDSPATAAGTDGGGYQYVTPAPTQGAFGGSDQPFPTSDGTADSGATPTPSAPVTVNVQYPAVAPGVYDTAPLTTLPAHISNVVGGGGPPKRPTVAAHAPAPAGALVALGPKENTSGNKNQGRRYETATKTVGTGKSKKVHVLHKYESAPGKGDWGKGGTVDMGPA